ncbi:MAG TPA: oligosaccharide flippase family protein [Gemmatimonadota bacterium]|nr:oligosaccharide flippase family protein [Gemmatimonadota bacterium]
MTPRSLSARAGSAFVWKSIELGGTKLIFLVRILVLGRLLAPEDFGLFAISVIAIGFLLSVTDFGMTQALVQRPETEARFLDAGWTVNLVRALAVAVVVVVGAPVIARLFEEPRATDLIRVLALQPVLNAGASIRLTDLIRDLRFRELVILGLAGAIINTVVSIALVKPLGVWALVAGPLAGSTLHMAGSYLVAPHRPRLSFDFESVRPLFSYGRWIFLTALCVVSGNLLLQVIISRRLGIEDLGLYFLATRLAFLPAEVSSQVAGAIAFPLYSRLQANLASAARAFRSMLQGMAVVLIPASLLLALLADSLVQNVLGGHWEGTQLLIAILACTNVVGLLGQAVIPVLRGTGYPQKQTLLQLVLSAMLILFMLGLTGRYGVVAAALAWILAVGLNQIFAFIFVRQILARPLAGLAPFLFAILTASTAGVAVAWSVEALLPGLLGLVLSAGLGLSVTGFVVWWLDRRLRLGLAADMARAFPPIAPLLRMEAEVT